MNRIPAAVRRHLVLGGGFAACVALAVLIGIRLSHYGVPLLLVLTCSYACLSAFAGLLFQAAGERASTTHRCPRKGCDFQVRLTHTDDSEDRRWQEIAANHPHRTT